MNRSVLNRLFLKQAILKGSILEKKAIMKQAILKGSMVSRSVLLLIIVTGIAVVSPAQTPGPSYFRQEGIASWYGTEFDGKPTASGEIFNAASYTAAHPSLPFGSILTVTNLQNDRRVTVKVNDRGPFVAERIIDLSLAAAEVLQMVETGTARVTVEYAANSMLGPAGNPPLPITPALANNSPPPTAQAPVAAIPPAAVLQQAPVPTSNATPQYAPTPMQPAPAPAAPQYTPAPVQPAAAPVPQYAPTSMQPTPAPAAPQYTPAPAQPAAAPVVPQYAPPPAQSAPTPEALYTPPAPIAAVSAPSVPQQAPVSVAPAYTPPPAQSAAVPTAPQYVAPSVQPAPTAPPVFSVPPASILGNVPAPGSSGSFRLQVASFRVPRNALNTFDKLKAAGLNPRYEQNGDLYRVVLPGLSADEIRPAAQILGENGFREVLIHRETN